MNLKALFLGLILPPAALAAPLFQEPAKNERIVLLANGLGERMQYAGYFESQLHLRYPEHRLTLRNLCYPGDTPAYRPRAGRNTPWAFPGGEKFHPELSQHCGEGHYPSEDEWLTICKADTILAFFGYNESFDGPAGVEKFRGELDAFVVHTLAQEYNGTSPPKLVLVSPIAFENLSELLDLPDGKRENSNLKLYTGVMRKVAAERQVNRDEAVLRAVEGKKHDLSAADAKTRPLDPVTSNFTQPIHYLKEAEALKTFTLMDGFQIALFASKYDFPDLANPVQMTFDNQ